MENFQYYTPTKVVFGKGTEDLTGELVKAQGCRKVLVHYGSGSVVRSGLLDSTTGAAALYGAVFWTGSSVRLTLQGLIIFRWAVWCPIRDCLLYMRA